MHFSHVVTSESQISRLLEINPLCCVQGKTSEEQTGPDFSRLDPKDGPDWSFYSIQSGQKWVKLELFLNFFFQEYHWLCNAHLWSDQLKITWNCQSQILTLRLWQSITFDPERDPPLPSFLNESNFPRKLTSNHMHLNWTSLTTSLPN